MTDLQAGTDLKTIGHDKGLPGAEESAPLSLVGVKSCVLCGSDDAEPVAVGEDFEYRSSPDSFLAFQCRACGLVYLNPRPSTEQLSRIYPPGYDALGSSGENHGLVSRVRRRMASRRLLSFCKGLPETASILVVSCGDRFPLNLLRDFGKPGWTLEGMDVSGPAVETGTPAYDLALLMPTIERVDEPVSVLSAIRGLLKPGGRLVIITGNTDTLNFRIFKHRHWGGYHFPRHWNLFNAGTLRAMATKAGLEIEGIDTLVSPVNWVLSMRNLLVDWKVPAWLANRFRPQSVGSMAAFTVFDFAERMFGRGGVLQAVLKRPL